MRNRGFSLIEVALALIIVGLVTAPMIAAYQNYLINKQFTQSQGYLQIIDKALSQYVAERGHYPLPAARNLTEVDAQFGQPYPNTPASLAAMPGCATTGGDVDVCRTPSPNIPGQQIYIGDVPFAALGLPKQYVRDGYGSKFTYAVSARLTDIATFAQDGGVIRLEDRSGGPARGSQRDNGGGVMVDAVHYVAVSHGADRVGGFGIFGALPLACNGQGRDRENCNNDGVFNNNFANLVPGDDNTYARFSVMPSGPDHYDDYLIYTINSGGGMWTMATMTTNNVVANSGAPIVLGQPQTPAAKMDVRGNPGHGVPGNVQADALRTNRLCDLGASDCDSTSVGPAPGGSPYHQNVFNPGIIAGEPYLETDIDPISGNPYRVGNFPGGGIHCGDRPMNGIANTDESCASAPAGFNIGGCTGGMKSRSVNASGQLICVTP